MSTSWTEPFQIKPLSYTVHLYIYCNIIKREHEAVNEVYRLPRLILQQKNCIHNEPL